MNHTCYSIDERPLKIEFTLQYRQKVSDFNKKINPLQKVWTKEWYNSRQTKFGEKTFTNKDKRKMKSNSTLVQIKQPTIYTYIVLKVWFHTMN